MPVLVEHEDTLAEAPAASNPNQNSAFHNSPLPLDALLRWWSPDVGKMPYTQPVHDKLGIRYSLREMLLITNDQHNCNEIHDRISTYIPGRQPETDLSK